jgi:glycosyltransferase involved in cell wall biosynthesis
MAIRSIQEQSCVDWELLLLDDGSTDKTLALAKAIADPRIKLIYDEGHVGLIARLNQAVNVASGEYFARMDGDDIAYPARLERQVEYLIRHPDVDLIGAGALIFGRNGHVIGKRNGPLTHAEICARYWAGFPIMHPTFCGRRNWFKRFGYKEKTFRAEDQDLLLRSFRYSRFSNVPEILLGYREERISLAKSLPGRSHYASSVVRDCMRRKRPLLALFAVLEQLAKGVLDGIAVGTGLQHLLLSHRARPLSSAEVQAWNEVWRLMNEMRS